MLSRTAYVSMLTLATAVAALASVSAAQAGMVGNANFGGSRSAMTPNSNFAGSKTVIVAPPRTPPRVNTPTPRPMINSNLKLHCHKYVDRTTNPGHPVMATTCH